MIETQDPVFANLMEQLRLTEIVMFDTDLDRIKGITRVKL
jgi:predicted nucleic acid-binding protein